MRDELNRIIHTELTNGGTTRTAANAIIAALPDMVQPLVWRETSGGSAAETPIGMLRVVRGTGSSWYSGLQFIEGDHYENAKAAAQADYTRLILSPFGITGET